MAMKEFLKATGGDKIAEWDKYFGLGLYGALLSIVAGILILAYPALISSIVALFLIIKGFIEIAKYSKRKSMEMVLKK